MTYTTWHNTVSFTEPADILIIDPCYILTHKIPELDKLWKDIREEWYPSGEASATASVGTITYKDIKLLYTKAYGDGYYKVLSYHNETVGDGIFVDAGMMCIVRLDDALKLNPELRTDLGVIIRGFEGEVTSTPVGFKGDLVVDTRDYSNEDEEDNTGEDDVDYMCFNAFML